MKLIFILPFLILIVASLSHSRTSVQNPKPMRVNPNVFNNYSGSSVDDFCAMDGMVVPTLNVAYPSKARNTVWGTSEGVWLNATSFLNNRNLTKQLYSWVEVDLDFIKNVYNPSLAQNTKKYCGHGVKCYYKFFENTIDLKSYEGSVVLQQLGFYFKMDQKTKEIINEDYVYYISFFEPTHYVNVVLLVPPDRLFHHYYHYIRKANLRMWAQEYAAKNYLKRSSLNEDATIFSVLPQAFLQFSDFRLKEKKVVEKEEVHLFKKKRTGTTLELRVLDKKTDLSNIDQASMFERLYLRRNKPQLLKEHRNFHMISLQDGKIQYLMADQYYKDKKRRWPELKLSKKEKEKKGKEKIQEEALEKKKYKGQTYALEMLIVSKDKETYLLLEAETGHQALYNDFLPLPQLKFDSKIQTIGDEIDAIVQSILAYLNYKPILEAMAQYVKPYKFLKKGYTFSSCDRNPYASRDRGKYGSELVSLPRNWYRYFLEEYFSVGYNNVTFHKDFDKR